MKLKKLHKKGNDAFICQYCGEKIEPLVNGSYRNHCPSCLWSKHLDIKPGDRKETCCGLMKPIRKEYKSKKSWMIVHRCTRCKKEQMNKVAPDDDFDLFVAIQ